MKLEGIAALVTGGSRGLGRALGGALAEAGARVVLVAREEGPLERAVAEIRGRGRRGPRAWPPTSGEKAAAHRIAGQAAALVGPLDLLINNASTLGPVPLQLLLDTDCEDLERALAVNLVGPFRLTKALLGPMVLRGRGLVVNISSDAAVEAYPSWGAYGASKAALDHLGRVWAAELEGTGVRVITVDPGEMNTRMHAEAIPDADPRSLEDPERVAQRIVRLVEDRALAPNGARVRAVVADARADAARRIGGAAMIAEAVVRRFEEANARARVTAPDRPTRLRAAATFPGSAGRGAVAGDRSGGGAVGEIAVRSAAGAAAGRGPGGGQRCGHFAGVAARARRARRRDRAAAGAAAWRRQLLRQCCSGAATGVRAPSTGRPPPRLALGSRLHVHPGSDGGGGGAGSRYRSGCTWCGFDRERRRSLGCPVPGGPAGAVRAPGPRAAAVGGAERVRGPALVVRDAVGGAAAELAHPAGAPPPRGAPGPR